MPFYFKYMLKSGMYQDFNVLFLGFWCLVFGAWLSEPQLQKLQKPQKPQKLLKPRLP